MRVGFVQMNPRFLKVRRNVGECIASMSSERADLWVLPELFSSGYRFRTAAEVRKAAEEVPDGFTCRRLREFATRAGCAVAAGIPEKCGAGAYNSAVFIDRDKTLVYRKTHLFCDEKKFFKPGDSGFWVAKVKGVQVGVMICFDWCFPEAARTLALKGAQVIAHCANLILPWGADTMITRSLENHVFSVTADRVGTERDLTFLGRSQVVNPNGELMVRASQGRSETRVIEIDPGLALDKRVTPRNDLLKDRRPEFYKM
ncbi:MAG: acyltransferase [Elusimicrobia bacterium]|nr:acyltransferase [Elusimicrobiota bacterium]